MGPRLSARRALTVTRVSGPTLKTRENRSMTLHSTSREAATAAWRPSSSDLLLILFLVSVLNFANRQIFGILMQPMAEDLGLSDSQLGFLSGSAFVLLYATAGIPLARLADRGRRALIIGWSVGVWSVMTVLCGAAGNIFQLMIARVGVGLGEAGVSPPAYSLIAESFDMARRATAMSIYSVGMPMGILLGYLVGGWVNELLGWRAAFIVMGMPGLYLAVVAFRTLRPVEQAASRTTSQEPLSLLEVLRLLFLTKSLRRIVIGFAVASFVSYGVGLWFPVYLIRMYGMSTGEVGTWLALIVGGMASAGILAGGYITDRFGQRDLRWCVRLPAYALLLTVPFSVIFAFAPSKGYALAALIPIVFLGFLDMGPVLSLLQSSVPPRSRATASAVLLMLTTLAGLGFGPVAIGVFSDALVGRLGSDALRYALLSGLMLYIVAAAFLWRAGETLRSDIVKAVTLAAGLKLRQASQ